MNFYVYILRSISSDKLYIGQTKDIINRVERHNAGYEKYTSKWKPWEMIFYTTCETRAEAMKLERKIKNFKSRKRIFTFIEDMLAEGRGSRKIQNL